MSILVHLPTFKELPTKHLEYEVLAEATEAFSGADIKSIVGRAGENTIEKILESGEDIKITQEYMRGC